ncbi:hypothetical protein J2S55_007406 [Streptosporangium brasiliense]|uniref:Uncharacterized protein n=1 Tax=Streptosporangium brasiliense TaxID=47480 RepID=A0ABT9RFX0_9ACTN|nr:hypothetical protein [Streptosporangium brasiliense]MDP9868140.1 hypothetical protein [Streptosporangium brasiliense]
MPPIEAPYLAGASVDSGLVAFVTVGNGMVPIGNSASVLSASTAKSVPHDMVALPETKSR